MIQCKWSLVSPAVEPWVWASGPTDRRQVVWGTRDSPWVKTTASVYIPQRPLPQTCVRVYARQWGIPATGKCVSVYLKSHPGGVLAKASKILWGFDSVWAVDSRFHKLERGQTVRVQVCCFFFFFKADADGDSLCLRTDIIVPLLGCLKMYSRGPRGLLSKLLQKKKTPDVAIRNWGPLFIWVDVELMLTGVAVGRMRTPSHSSLPPPPRLLEAGREEEGEEGKIPRCCAQCWCCSVSTDGGRGGLLERSTKRRKPSLNVWKTGSDVSLWSCLKHLTPCSLRKGPEQLDFIFSLLHLTPPCRSLSISALPLASWSASTLWMCSAVVAGVTTSEVHVFRVHALFACHVLFFFDNCLF